MSKPTVEELQKILDSTEERVIVSNPDGSISTILKSSLHHKKWRLSNEVSLRGTLREISMMEFRAHPGEIIDAVELGAIFLVKRGKRIVAVLLEPPLPGKMSSLDLTITVDENGKIGYALDEPNVSKTVIATAIIKST